ncbi:MAG: hypothetical protein IIA60_13815 [Candidatus Marinimicrobia bacterium]|nr:hypothetical protein [Candidatus Neomarinimicrobiota bacterium]
MSKPTADPKVSRWWWRALRTWVYSLVDPLWAAFRGENGDDIALTNVTSINGVSSTELTVLDGLTATTAELNLLTGLTATAAELNKADRTEQDGSAQASKNVVLNADGDILGKRFDINLSHRDALAGQPYFRSLAATSTGINIGASILNKDHAAVLFMARIRSGGSILSNNTIYTYRFIRLLVSGFSFETDTNGDGLGDSLAIDGDVHCYALVFSGATAYIYRDGKLTNSGAINDDLNLGRIFRRSSLDSVDFDGDAWGFRFFNRALAADEIKKYASGAPVDYAETGASETDLMTNGDDWTGATGSTPPNSWSDSGGASVTYIIRDNTGVANMDDKVLEMDITGSGSKTMFQGVFQAGKRYRVTFAYRNLDGSGGATKVTFGSAGNSATLQNTTISGDGVIFTQEVLADGSDLAFEVTTAGALQLDAVQVVQTGCVADYRPDGITPAQWQDASGNGLHGSVNGAIPLNLPSNHLARYEKQGITADTTLTEVVPAGYRIRGIIVEETAGNAITGGLKIGTSAGGTQVVNAQAIGASALVDCALGTRLFSLSAAQTLYVEDVTAWNGASIDLYLEMERIK